MTRQNILPPDISSRVNSLSSFGSPRNLGQSRQKDCGSLGMGPGEQLTANLGSLAGENGVLVVNFGHQLPGGHELRLNSVAWTRFPIVSLVDLVVAHTRFRTCPRMGLS